MNRVRQTEITVLAALGRLGSWATGRVLRRQQTRQALEDPHLNRVLPDRHLQLVRKSG